MDYKKIPLSQGKFALVDADDFEFLNQWKWYFHKSGYAMRMSKPVNGKRKSIIMHRVIFNTPEDMITDHINGNQIDNRKSNLRNATSAQNAMNRKVSSTNKLGVKGVSYEEYSNNSKTPRKNHYKATIKVNQKNIFLGSYSTIKAASQAYKNAASKFFGEFGRAI